MKRRGVVAVILVVGLFTVFLIGRTATQSTQQSDAEIVIKRASSAIALTADNKILLAVNPDSNTLTLIDTVTRTRIAEIPIGIDPRTVAVNDAGTRAYVANRGSDSISVIDLASEQQIREIPVGHRPYGVVVSPDGERLYAAEQGSGRLHILDTNSFDSVAAIDVGDRPSGLAINNEGDTLYITHLLTNNITRLEIRPFNSYLPLILQVTSGWQQMEGSNFHTTSTDLHSAIDSSQVQIQLWSDSNLLQSIVLDPDGSFAYVPHTRSFSSNLDLSFSRTVFPLVSIIDLTTEQHLTGQQFNLGTLDPPGVGLPFDAALTPDGSELWVLNSASNDITVIDLTTRQRVAHIEVGDNPRGIVLSTDGTIAYVNNTLAGTISVVDTVAYQVTDTITSTQIPLPPLLLQGKRLFYSSDDPRMSKEQWIACNSCHFDGEHDGQTWFFGFAGPRNTTSLLGMIQTYPLRWSGEWDESADSEFVIRKENFGSGLIAGTMNCSLSPADCVTHPPNQGRDDALDALAAYIDSLSLPLSPSHIHGEELTDAEQRGYLLFNRPDLGCLTCHPPPLYTDHLSHDVGTGTADERISPAYDTPSLRGLYNSAPYFHDGSATTLYNSLTFPSINNEHDVSGLLTETEIQDLITFMMALPFLE